MRIAISTGGGDCPGLNAVIRGAVRTAVAKYGWSVFGIEDGLQGLLRPEPLRPLTPASVRGILPRGGTILGTTNRGNPFGVASGELGQEDIPGKMIARLEAEGIDAVIFVGGDGTQTIAQRFRERGLKVIGVPKTIDNDLDATDYTFGFDTAVGIAMEAVDRLHTTAESHDRVMVLEVMGRHAGWIALHAGISGGAHVILLPEIPYSFDAVLAKIRERQRNGLSFSVLVVSEGAYPAGEAPSFRSHPGKSTNARLGGAAEQLVERIERETDFEARATVLGHIQRGGSPSHFDRLLGTRFGYHAVELAAAQKFGRMVCLRGTEIGDVDLLDAMGQNKQVDPHGQICSAARAIGICLGD